MAPDDVSETPMLRSSFDSGRLDQFTPVDPPESNVVSNGKKHSCQARINIKHHVALFSFSSNVLLILIPTVPRFSMALLLVSIRLLVYVPRSRVSLPTWRLHATIRILLMIGKMALDETDPLAFLLPPPLLCFAASSS